MNVRTSGDHHYHLGQSLNGQRRKLKAREGRKFPKVRVLGKAHDSPGSRAGVQPTSPPLLQSLQRALILSQGDSCTHTSAWGSRAEMGQIVLDKSCEFSKGPKPGTPSKKPANSSIVQEVKSLALAAYLKKTRR